MTTMWVERLSHEGGEWKWKPFKEEFDLEADFAINEEGLNAEICRMGQLLVRYGNLDAEQRANLQRKEEHAKLVKANCSAAIRSEAETKGQKITVGEIEEKTIAHPIYQQALSELHILRADANKADHWWRAIIKKAELLNAAAFRQNAEIKRMPG